MKDTRKIYRPLIDIDEYSVPIGRGGSSAGEASRAVDNLGLLDGSDVMVEGGVAPLDSFGKLDPSVFRGSTTYKTLRIDNPGISFYVGTPSDFRITNYDAFTNYVVTATNGFVSRVKDVITYIPSTAGAGGFVLNGIPVNLTVLATAAKPVAPYFVNLLNGQSNVPQCFILKTSEYTNISGILKHAGTNWQIATDAAFTSLVLNEADSATFLTSYPVSNLSVNTVYYARARYKNSSGTWSDYSPTVVFKTAMAFGNILNGSYVGSDVPVNGRFGRSVALTLDKSRLVVGAPQTGGTGPSYRGAAYVFTRDGSGNYVQEAKLTMPAGTDRDILLLGSEVAINAEGNVAFVGATHYSSDNIQSGAVVEFRRSGVVWTQTRVIVTANPTPGEFTGSRVVLSADDSTLAVLSTSTVTRMNQTVSTGKLSIYRKNGSDFYELEGQFFNNDVSNYYGIRGQLAISIDGNSIFAGQPLATIGPFYQAGKVYAYTRDAGVWAKQQEIYSKYVASQGLFGNSMKMNAAGTRLYVTHFHPAEGHTNSVEIFNKVNGVWTFDSYIELDAGTIDFDSSMLNNSDGSIFVNSSETVFTVTYRYLTQNYAAVYLKISGKWQLRSVISKGLADTTDSFARHGLMSSDGTELFLTDINALTTGNATGRIYKYTLTA